MNVILYIYCHSHIANVEVTNSMLRTMSEMLIMFNVYHVIRGYIRALIVHNNCKSPQQRKENTVLRAVEWCDYQV